MTKPDYMTFDASQLHIPSSQQIDQQQVGLTMIPEENFSKLNLSNNNNTTFLSSSTNFTTYQSVNAYAVTDVPARDPVELLIASPLPDGFAAGAADVTVLLAKLDAVAGRMGMGRN